MTDADHAALKDRVENKFFVAGQMDAQGHAAEKFKIGSGGTVLAMSRRLLEEARNDLAALLQAAAPPAPTAEQVPPAPKCIPLPQFAADGKTVEWPDEHRRLKYSQMDLDAQTKPLHVEIERLRAAPPVPTAEPRLRAALQRIADEYGDCRCEHDDENCCAFVADYCCPSCLATVALRETLPAMPPAPTAEPPAKVKQAVFLYLNTLVITSDNIGDIRRSLFMPFDCKWNGWVRDMTAELENKSSCAAPPERVSEGKDEHSPLCMEGVYAGDQRMPCDCQPAARPAVEPREEPR